MLKKAASAIRRLRPSANRALEKAGQILNNPPSANSLAEAGRLLDLAERRNPSVRPRVLYWRAVAATHAGDYDAAARHLTELFDWPDDSERRSILLSAWQLALLLHPTLEARVGREQLQIPGRKLEAIAAVERTLSRTPGDPLAWALKRLLYPLLTESEFRAGPVREFDFSYVDQLGQAQIEDSQNYHRGIEFLRMAACGLAAESPHLHLIIADTLTKHGQSEKVDAALQAGKQAGMAFGPKQLPDQSRHAYYSILKRLAENAERQGDLDAAAENLSLYAEFDRSGLETLRHLADLHERRGDVWAALNAVERARLYDARDADLRDRRDRYLYSIEPADLQRANESQRNSIDVVYCVNKARELVNLRDADTEILQWAKHLIELALVIQPASMPARVVAARIGLRSGDRDAALQMLEDIREQGRGIDEDEWQIANRLLADLYLNEMERPDLAVPCLLDFRKSSKSGADTLYKLGVAYEQLNDRAQAANYYQQAASYDGHPLAADARDGLQRVRFGLS